MIWYELLQMIIAGRAKKVYVCRENTDKMLILGESSIGGGMLLVHSTFGGFNIFLK